jgi:hypothetical protein
LEALTYIQAESDAAVSNPHLKWISNYFKKVEYRLHKEVGDFCRVFKSAEFAILWYQSGSKIRLSRQKIIQFWPIDLNTET